MDRSLIDNQFSEMIRKHRISKKLGITPVMVRYLRHRNKNGLPIRLETKIKMLQRFGILMDSARWRDQDMVELLKFYQSASQATREMGPSYVFEKYIQKIEQKRGSPVHGEHINK